MEFRVRGLRFRVLGCRQTVKVKEKFVALTSEPSMSVPGSCVGGAGLRV